MTEVKNILKGDRYIWGIYFILCMISLIEIYSATSTLTYKLQDYFAPTIRHTLILLVGTVFVIALHNIHYKYFKLIPVIVIPIAFVTLIYTLFAGEEINGAQRVIRILGFPLQPSELAKLGVVTALAFVLARKQEGDGVAKDTFKICMFIILPLCALIFPENFSTAFLLGAVCFCIMLIGRVELKKLLGLVGIMVVVVVLVFVIVPHLPKGVPGLDRAQTWINRVTSFSGNEQPAYLTKTTDYNYQVHHGHMAVANGGVFGVFPGNSRERDFLPQAYSDFIYAIIIEEMGLVGGIFVMALYLWLLIRAGMIARKCTRAAPAFLIMGITLIIVFQAIMHMAVSVGLMPVTGQPLPLISRGGTSIIIVSIYFGIILSISHYAANDAEQDSDAQEAGISEDRLASETAGDKINEYPEIDNMQDEQSVMYDQK